MEYIDVKMLGTLIAFVALLWLVAYLMKPKATAPAGTPAATTTTP